MPSLFPHFQTLFEPYINDGKVEVTKPPESMVIKTELDDNVTTKLDQNSTVDSDPEWKPGCADKKKGKKTKIKSTKNVPKNNAKKRGQEKSKNLSDEIKDNLKDKSTLVKSENNLEINSGLKNELDQINENLNEITKNDDIDKDVKNAMKMTKTSTIKAKYKQNYKTITPETAHLPKYKRPHCKAKSQHCQLCSEQYKGHLGYARLLCHQWDKHQIPIKVPFRVF